MSESILNKVSAVYDGLKLALESEKNKQHYRYLLVDRLAVVSELSLIYNKALQDTIAPELLAIIKRPELVHNLERCPLLVCLAEPDEPLNNELLLASMAQIKNDYLTRKQYVCGFLASPLIPDELADELLESCLRAGKVLGNSFFPFYEPFMLDVLRYSYDKPELHLGLLLPAYTRYYFVDTDVSACTFNAIPYQDDSDFTLQFVNERLRYNLLNQAELYRLMLNWLDLCERQDKLLPQGSLASIIHYFYDSQASRLSNASDKRAYVLFSLQYGQLTNSDELSNLLNDVIDHDDKHGQLGRLLSQESQALNSLTGINAKQQ